MIFRDDVIFLIDEYVARFGEAPAGLNRQRFPSRRDWLSITRAIRVSLDTDMPIRAPLELSQAA
ncbi:MAG: hypothetical protein AAGJ70_09300 [Pseudomonadota bacterium]